MDRLFKEVAGEFAGWAPFTWAGARAFPALNAWEDGQNLYVEAELPGVRMENIELTATGNELTLAGRRDPGQAEGITPHRRERGVGEFSRTVRLPVSIDTDRVAATLADGVLTLSLPKPVEAKPRKIEVKQPS